MAHFDTRRADNTRTLPATPPSADADLSKRKIESKGSGAFKNVAMLLVFFTFTTLLTFDHFPRAHNHSYYFHFIRNQGTVEVVSMFARFVSTPLLFVTKFIVKSLVYKGRTVVIKMPLVRHVMPKRELGAFLRRRQEERLERRSERRSEGSSERRSGSSKRVASETNGS